MSLFKKFLFLFVINAFEIMICYGQGGTIYKSCQDLIDHIVSIRKSGDHELVHHLVSGVSCAICIRSLCPEHYSDCFVITQRFPIYVHMFEFGLVGGFVPKHTTATVIVNTLCYVKVDISNQFNGDWVVITISECGLSNPFSTAECRRLHYEIFLDMDYDNKCVQIGLMFADTHWVYTAISSSCGYVPTAYYDSIMHFDLKFSQCTFDPGEIFSAKFAFSQDHTRLLHDIPIALPCSPGGYVVNPFNGLFQYGDACWHDLHEERRSDESFGIDFVIRKLYGSEDFKFPLGNITGVRENLYPVYFEMDKDGDFKPIARGKMQYKKELNQIMVGKRRYGCGVKVRARNGTDVIYSSPEDAPSIV